ncbi:hypothetical protein MPSEU_000221800 [Mayamaea pseudoterrestris]|nr:hypothetical protein MPSEU_000221800 [Mayamaea pseudoterrestris]
MRAKTLDRFVLILISSLCMLHVQAFRVTAAISGKRTLQFSSTILRNINGDHRNNNGDNNKDQKTPKTGWNHKLPSKDSPFWKSNEEESTTEQDVNGNSKPNRPLRTGWLHNTAPAKSQQTKQTEVSQDSDSSSSSKLSLARQRLTQAMTMQSRNHEIHVVSFPASGSASTSLAVTEHSISVPLNRSSVNDKRRVRLYFTIVETIKESDRAWWQSFSHSTQSPFQRAQQYVQHSALTNANDMMLYLQGGPGFGAPAPVSGVSLSAEGSWLGAALPTFSKIVLMDQRGTGQSSPVTKQSLELMFPDLFLLDDVAVRNVSDIRNVDDHLPLVMDQLPDSDTKQAVQAAVDQVFEYLTHFRADNIVLDAEEIRDALMLPPNLNDDDAAPTSDPIVPKPWGASLGQSFGGFCSMTYLSLVEHPPQKMLLTGGIAPQLTPCRELYASLWVRVRDRSLQYYEMYPTDVAIVKKIVRTLLKQPVDLPSRGKLTARRFLQLGLGLGGTPSAFASLHQLISMAILQVEGAADSDAQFRRSFLKQLEVQQSFDDAPFYFWLHESIYGDGPGTSTNWAAHRAYLDKCQESSDFDYTVTCQEGTNRPVLFFGEMVFPWMSEDYAELQGVGLAAVAERLAQKSDWTPLYDAVKMRQALDGKVKAAAAVYYGDMYVDFDACMQVTKRGSPLEHCKVWISNEYQHSGLRDDGAKIFTKLLGMAQGNIRTPS